MNQEQLSQLIIFVIFLAVLIPVIFPILSIGMGFMTDAFCSSTVQLRSFFNNLFLGAFGRALIPDEVFNAIPLMCRVHITTVSGDDAEEEIANEIVDCFNRYGARQLDGVFPHASILCSAIIYDAPADSENELDLMKIYSLMVNHNNFNPAWDYDRSDDYLDYMNNFRFCLKPEYQINILQRMHWGEGFCKGSYDKDTGELTGDSCSYELTDEDLNAWFDENALESNINSCLSVKEAAMNDWELDMSESGAVVLDELYPSENNLITLCNDLCKRDCEEISESYDDYEVCNDDCSSSCNDDCSRSSCSDVGSNHFNFDKDLTIFKPYDSSVGTSDFTKATVLHRGVFYIRFYDYADWIQQFGDENWHYFPECENNIIILRAGAQMEAISIWEADVQEKHDYIAVCYEPYVPYNLVHSDELGEPADYLVMVT